MISPLAYTTLITIAGFLVGILFGRITWGRLEKPESEAALLPPPPELVQARREVASLQAQIKPLADDVDRLKRELARARKAEPAALPAPEAALPDIRQLKGVGDKFAHALGAVGLGSIGALAALDDAGIAATDTQLGVFNGRLKRDRLVEQARLLSEGRTTEYEARFGKLGGAVGR